MNDLMIGGIVGVIADLFIISKINEKRMPFNWKNILLIILTAIVTPLTFFITNNAIRLVLMIVVNTFIYKDIFQFSVSRSTISSIISLIVAIVAEIVYTAILTLIFGLSMNDLQTIIKGSLLTNVFIYYIAICIISIPILHQKLSNIIDWYDRKKKSKMILFLFLLVGSLWIVGYINVTQQFDVLSYIMTAIFVISLSSLGLELFREKIVNENTTTEYLRLKSYVRTYENLLDDLKESQHENKNKFITIRGMITKNNKKLFQYVDHELDSITKVKHNWIIKLKNITDGGLKGLFYSKIMRMEKEGIHFFLDISKTIKDNDKIENLSIEHYKNLCIVIGVYLDNAIDAATEVEDPQVLIEFFCLNNKLQFVITNNYKMVMTLDDIDSPGVSSKGENHGYGLSLVNKIINKNKGYKQHRELTDEFYVQYFEINLDE